MVINNMGYKIKLDRVQTDFYLLDFDAVTGSSKLVLVKNCESYTLKNKLS